MPSAQEFGRNIARTLEPIRTQGPQAAGGVLRRVVEAAIDGIGRLPSAKHAAGKHLTKCAGYVDDAIESVIESHIMLGSAQGFVTNIGGLATLIGSPPTLVMAGFVEDAYGISIGFASWMLLGVPLAATFLLVAWLFLTRVAFPSQLPSVAAGRQVLRGRIDELGRMSSGEWMVLVVFVTTALLWVVREPLAGIESLVAVVPLVASLSDESIVIAAAVVLLSVPVPGRGGEPTLRWSAAQAGLPWGVLLLFGGGLAISAQFTASGLSAWIGGQVSVLAGIPLWVLILVVTALVLFLTELTSNTATAATFLPILGGVAMGMDMDVLTLVVPVALAASMAFMLPVATPPNAIVFGTGHVRIGEMIRGGLWLNLIALVLVLGSMYALFSWALGIAL
jgi:sodium-dependent dicarboxylate transporter 2/3/5